jgi:hypothetical protein
MRLLTIHVVPNEGADDIITFDAVSRYPDLVNITTHFTTEAREPRVRSFTIPRMAATEYVATVMNSLIVDSDPVKFVQVTSCMFPAIMYEAEKLDEWAVKNSIQEIVYATLTTTVQ